MSAVVPSPKANTALLLPVTVCVLCYGNHPDLAQRVLGSLIQFAQRGDIRLRLGLNGVSERSWAAIAALLPSLKPELVIRSETNQYKAPMMRRLFYDQPLTTAWTIWFDDDSFVERCDWLEILSCQSRLEPAIDMWGERLFVRVDEEYLPFIRASLWYRGRELEADDQPGVYRLSFIAGGYWAIRTACLRELKWPDDRLLHFGDDYLLGEALRQNGKTIGQCVSGIAVNQSIRRAPVETPSCHVLH